MSGSVPIVTIEQLIHQARPLIKYLAENWPECPALDASIDLHTMSIRERTSKAILAASSHNPPAVLNSIVVWVNGDVLEWIKSKYGAHWITSITWYQKSTEVFVSDTIALLTAIVGILKNGEGK